mgnify:CR=1 FL=1
MSAEAEHILKRLNQTRNVTNKRGKIIQKETRILPYRERAEREKEKTDLKGFLSQPPWAMKDVSQEGLASLKRRLNRLEDEAEEYYPPTDLSGQTKDALYKQCEQWKAEWMEGMPTQEVMRRNPAGAVDMHMKWEKKTKNIIKKWKNGMRILEPENEDKDYTNIERFRPSGLSPETLAASFMANAQIPGNFAMSSLAKANWPLGDPKVDTPLKHAERNEIAEEMITNGFVPVEQFEALKAEIKKMQEQISRKEVKTKEGRSWTEEQKQAARERLAKAREAKKQKLKL